MSDPSVLRVLIVEDQALLALELDMVLSEFGCEVVGSAMDAEGALEIAARERIDLALVDVNLLDGFTGPQIARTLIEDHAAVVIFLTANLEQIPEGYVGALGAVSKPFDEATIRGVVAFAHQFILHKQIGIVPRRFRLAPWLMQPPPDATPN